MFRNLRILLPMPKNYIYNYATLNNDVRHNLQVGTTISVIRKITREDILKFAELTNDFNPIHTKDNEPIVHGALLNGILSGVLGTKLPGPGTIVLEQQLNYKNPCYAGDSVEIIVKVLSVRKIIKCSWKLIANGERIVLEGEGKFILTKVDDNHLNKVL
uniref:MaoC-like domain-containing protein n=1 Tax=Bracon brevicornis TaxID=1563983 RepID=A0A6V7ITX6_9HYME